MISWRCASTWKRASLNTSWCLAGCSVGDFSALALLSHLHLDPLGSPLLVALPLASGLATSVALETAVLARREAMPWRAALRTAVTMSFSSMLAMEAAMEAADYLMTGGLSLQLWALPGMLLAGFLTPLPYNYYRLKRHGRACH